METGAGCETDSEITVQVMGSGNCETDSPSKGQWKLGLDCWIAVQVKCSGN